MHRIMMVDDEENVLSALKRVLRQERSWQIETYTDPEVALTHAHSRSFDLFLSDYRMPRVNGVEFLTEIKKLQPESMRLILSGQTDLDALTDAINEAQIFRFLAKPWAAYDLITTIKHALAHHDILVENKRLADQVREQQAELSKKDRALEVFKARHPALADVQWESDGSIILNDAD